MQHLKAIFLGRLDFGNPKSFEKVFQMFRYRADNHYRSTVLVREEHFSSEANALIIPKSIFQTDEKFAKNTILLLEYLSHFAVAGKISYWVIRKDKASSEGFIEPDNDKFATRAFNESRSLAKAGKTEEAIEKLSTAIEKYPQHSRAFELRGSLYRQLGNEEDALCDFTRCIQIDPFYGKGYLGRALIRMSREEYEGASEDFDNCIKWSFAKQSYHWQSRKLKAQCQLKLSLYDEAEKELRFFLSRKFEQGDPNYKARKFAKYLYGQTLMQLGRFEEAIETFEEAIKIQTEVSTPKKFEILTQCALAKKQCGEQYIPQLKEAADLGSTHAQKLLVQLA